MSFQAHRGDQLCTGRLPRRRQRIATACEECRRRKIKCNGQNPCTHCVGYGFLCLYSAKPEKKHRSGAASRFEDVSERLNRLEERLQADNDDLNDKNPVLRMRLACDTGHFRDSKQACVPQSTHSASPRIPSDEVEVDAMMTSKGQLSSDHEGNWGYSGSASVAAFLQRLQDIFGKSVDLRVGAPERPFPILKLRLFQPTSSFPHHGSGVIFPLSKERALDLVASALDNACYLLHFIHRPSFDHLLDLILEGHLQEDNVELRRSLALFYALLALGCLFDHKTLEISGFDGATLEGTQYFIRSRDMIDIVDCRDISSLQTLVVLNMFLQCVGRLSQCYSYLGITVTLALRMGLHQSISAGVDIAESEIRRGLFWTIKNMETRLSVVLGLPRLIGEDDIDLDTRPGVTQSNLFAVDQTPGTEDVANAYSALTRIMGRVMKYVYPVKGQEGGISGKYTVSYTMIHKLGSELESCKACYSYWLDDNITNSQTLRYEDLSHYDD